MSAANTTASSKTGNAYRHQGRPGIPRYLRFGHVQSGHHESLRSSEPAAEHAGGTGILALAGYGNADAAARYCHFTRWRPSVPCANSTCWASACLMSSSIPTPCKSARPSWAASCLSRDRDERHPLVIAGGHACFNPEPMADFIDAFVIGEGEESHRRDRQSASAGCAGLPRHEQLRAIAKIQGMYVPRFYDVEYNDRRHRPLDSAQRERHPRPRAETNCHHACPSPSPNSSCPISTPCIIARRLKSCAAVRAAADSATRAW